MSEPVLGEPVPTQTAAAIEKVAEAIEDACLTHLGRDIGTIHRNDIAEAAFHAIAGLVRTQVIEEAQAAAKGPQETVPAHRLTDYGRGRYDAADDIGRLGLAGPQENTNEGAPHA